MTGLRSARDILASASFNGHPMYASATEAVRIAQREAIEEASYQVERQMALIGALPGSPIHSALAYAVAAIREIGGEISDA